MQDVVQRGSQKVDHVQSESTKSRSSDIGLIFFSIFYPVDVYRGFDILNFSAPNRFTIARILNTMICFRAHVKSRLGRHSANSCCQNGYESRSRIGPPFSGGTFYSGGTYPCLTRVDSQVQLNPPPGIRVLIIQSFVFGHDFQSGSYGFLSISFQRATLEDDHEPITRYLVYFSTVSIYAFQVSGICQEILSIL